LHQIVSIRILNQILNVLNDIVCKFKLLPSGALLKTSLHHTASMLMLANLNAISHAGIKDELSVLTGQITSGQILVSGTIGGFEDHEERLDDMVTMHVHCQLDNILVKSLNHLRQGAMVDAMVLHAILLVVNDSKCESVDQCLDCSSAVKVQRDVNDVANDLIYYQIDCLWVSYFNDLLAQVVAELVVHHSRDYWKHAMDQALQEGAFFVLVGAVHGSLDHLLKHSASTLIEAIEVKIVENLLLLLAEAGDHFLDRRSLLLALLRGNLLVLSFNACI
jgi:hypothetical protein